MKWRIVFTGQARKDAKELACSGLKDKAQILLQLLSEDPFRTPPPDARLTGDLAGVFSRRITIQQRLVYQVLPELGTVRVLRMRAHCQ